MAESVDTPSGEEPEGTARSRGRRRSTRRTTTKKSTADTTGRDDTAQQAEGDTAGAEEKKQEPKAATKAAKKTTKRSTSRKSTGKSTAKKAPAKKSTTQQKQPEQAEETGVPATAVLAADFDRSQLTPKMRVHALAKLLGMTSKSLIAELDKIGLVKVAQSTLSLEESGALLDALGEPAEQAPGTPDAEPVEKIRQRVEKNVENEIHQIEEKVERELAETSDQRDESAPAELVQGPDETAAAVEPREETEEFGASTGDEQDTELLEDVTPDVTPPPADAPAFRAPIFRAPRVGEDSETSPAQEETTDTEGSGEDSSPDNGAGETGTAASRRRRRGRRGGNRGRGGDESPQQPAGDELEDATADTGGQPLPEEPVALKGSTRLESQKRRRAEMREENKKKRHIVSQAEFLARRESVDRTMVVRERHRHDHEGMVTQVGVLEDDLLAEHFVTSEEQASLIGNIYLGRVQNVLPSMEAAFIDIGKGRNGVLYAGEVDWKSAGLGGRSRRIEQALRSGDQVLVQVTKDPVGHKGARLTTQISLAGRFLVYVPGGRSAGISRKLPAPERKRLKEILKAVVPGQGGAIIRTAAEGVSEEAIGADVQRLHQRWEDIQEAASQEMNSKGAKPVTMYEEPNMLIKVIRDLFNEDFQRLVVDGGKAWNMVHAYVKSVAPELLDRLQKFDRKAHDGADAFGHFRVDEQLQKALSRKVWLPSGGSLVIDRTEAMTVIDVNTGKFTGSGGNLEETVTRNNLEAAEEIVRQIRLRDIGGMLVIDFIDMVLPENRDLVLRRLTESLGRDRTRHQVSEVTSLGLVQMTRKRLGTGLLETFSTECEHCGGRGLILHDDPVEHEDRPVYSKHAKKAHGPERKQRGAAAEKQPAGQAAQQEQIREQRDEDAKSIEQLAAAVISDDSAAQQSAGQTQQPAEETSTSRRRGRGRRRSEKREVATERRVPVAEQPEEVGGSDLESIVSAAVSRADLEDPEEPSGTSYSPQEAGEQPREAASREAKQEAMPAPAKPRGKRGKSTRQQSEQSYEQAVAEFEASPRRKRRTRGNSRSDHRPDPADFANDTAAPPQSPAGEPEQAEKPGRETPSGREEPVPATRETSAPAEPETTPASEPQRGRRGRRRAVRRSSGAASREQTPEPSDERSAASRAEPDEQPEREPSQRSGRRRRRVVRKSPQAGEAKSGDAPGGGKQSSRSGRRTTRRSNR